mmetsp:Transcript_20404/g.25763  ORF Transcript_20404/g.25763 Transcript_20404/m.25763 type:complete len:271 (+) Transcript_20404:2-814(+)
MDRFMCTAACSAVVALAVGGGAISYIYFKQRHFESTFKNNFEIRRTTDVQVKLYGDPVSTCTRKVIQILHEKNYSFNLQLVSLKKKEQKELDYMARHPFGKVPMIETSDGFVLYESEAIVRYFDAILPGPQFTPKSLQERATMDKWISVYTSYLKPPQRKIRQERFLKQRYGRGECDEEAVSKAIVELEPVLEAMEQQLRNTTYIAGDDFSLADLLFGPDFASLLHEKGVAELIDKRINLKRWWNLCQERSAWKTTYDYMNHYLHSEKTL